MILSARTVQSSEPVTAIAALCLRKYVLYVVCDFCTSASVPLQKTWNFPNRLGTTALESAMAETQQRHTNCLIRRG